MSRQHREQRQIRQRIPLALHPPGQERPLSRPVPASTTAIVTASKRHGTARRSAQKRRNTSPGPFRKGFLLHLWPSYFAYLLSFVIIGIYWSNHHYVFKLYQKTNHSLNLLNLLFLLFIAFLPFPTEVLGEYMLDEANQTTAVTFYASSLLLTAASWLLIWLYATWGHRLIDRHLDSGYLRRMTLQYVSTVALYSSAVLVSPFNSKLGLGICVGLTLLYLLPPKSPADLRPEHQ